jgi:hypothetical protein
MEEFYTEVKRSSGGNKMPPTEKKVFDVLISTIAKREDPQNFMAQSSKEKQLTVGLKKRANTMGAPYGEVLFPEVSTESISEPKIQQPGQNLPTIQTPAGPAVLVPGKISSKSGKQVYRLSDGRFWEQ